MAAVALKISAIVPISIVHKGEWAMAEATDFELSRAYASGWSAARKNFVDDPKAAKNPFPEGAAHDRWAEGYADAIAGNGK